MLVYIWLPYISNNKAVNIEIIIQNIILKINMQLNVNVQYYYTSILIIIQ